MTVDIPWQDGLRLADDDEPQANQQALSKDYMISPGSQFQITNLDHANPLVKLSSNDEGGGLTNLSLIDGNILQTKWAKLIGTDLIFDDYGEHIGTVREHLVCQLSKVQPKEKEEDFEELKREKGEEAQTLFYRKAMAAAKRAER